MIIDCFPFFNELDLLEIRLNELADVVDYHVLSEATLTFTGMKKPLYYEQNKGRFEKFKDKIRHVIIDDYSNMNVADPRSMDRNQKQAGIDEMLDHFQPKPTDMVILSDCDEIPKAERVREAADGDWQYAMIEMRLYYYYMNCMALGRPGSWRNPRLVRPNGSIHYNSTRKGRSDKDYWDGGWHFSFLDDIQYKIASYTHAPQFDRPPYNTKRHMEEKKARGEDLFNRKRYRYEFQGDLSYLPEYVLNNMDRFDKYIWTSV